MANKKFKNNDTLDSSQVYDRTQQLTLNDALKNTTKLIKIDNINGTTYAETTFRVTSNSGLLVVSNAGLLYVSFAWDPSKSAFYISSTDYLVGASDNFTVTKVDAHNFTLRVPSYAYATGILSGRY